MIRPYEIGDEKLAQFNGFSDPSVIPEVFADASYIKHTVVADGLVKIIACWKEYQPECYATFLLMANDVGISDCKELKRLLNDVTMKLKPKHVLTYSHDCALLNRWHEFLGFKKETENGLLVEGKKFNKWVMKWA